jgi:hypothetical protein
VARLAARRRGARARRHQLVPTRFGCSIRRAAPASREAAATWSTRPLRLVGWSIRGSSATRRATKRISISWRLDRQYPFLLSIYPGLLVTVLGGAALLRAGVPRRAALILGVGGGILLGLGRHEPLWPLLHHLPLLAQTRYPEKFLLLALACLTFAAALESIGCSPSGHPPAHRRRLFCPGARQRPARRRAGRGVFTWRREAENFVRSLAGAAHGGGAQRGVQYLQRETLLGAAWCAAAAAVLLARPGAAARGGGRAQTAVSRLLHHGALGPTLARAISRVLGAARRAVAEL